MSHWDNYPDRETLGQSKSNPLRIGQLNWLIKNILESTVPKIWVEGEITDLSRPSSGHLYFTLKDSESQIRSVVWRSNAQRLQFQPKDGMSVLCAGSVEVYPPRGSYQLIVDRLEPKGEGPLQVAFRQLHEKLSAEGLFEASRKQQLPTFPQRVGFVTSPSGAAIHDFLEASRSRWSDFHLWIVPSRVQGDQAANELVRGIRLAHAIRPRLDVLVVGRGGGSMEDLWCFNDERVVRAIARSTIPVVSAVGHEIDVTLSDLVADVRALTPTHAAQLVFPSQQDLRSRLEQVQKRISHMVQSKTRHHRLRLSNLTERGILARPHEIHRNRSQHLDELESVSTKAIWQRLQSSQERLASLARASEALSPLNVLSRGYSLTQDADTKKTLRSIRQLESGQTIRTLLEDGVILSTIQSFEES